MQGRINAFQTLGTLEGPGIRFVVFFQGCPLRCAYCHNPETWDMSGGTLYTSKEILEKALRYKSYFGENGGITLSGGEPLLQSAFAAELLRGAKAAGLHTAICTAGTSDLEGAQAVLEYTDLVIADLKFTTEEEYRQYCRGNLKRVLNFLHLTRQMGIPLWIRQVIVPNLERLELLPFRKLCLEKYDALNIPFPLQAIPEADQAAMQPLWDIVNNCK